MSMCSCIIHTIFIHLSNNTLVKLHTQEGQDFSASAAAAHLIAYMRSESRSVDLVNNGMGNHYLRDVDHGSIVVKD